MVSGLLGLLGGIALLIGFLTRWVAAAMAIELIVALAAINVRVGFSASQGGAEFPLLALAGLLSLVLSGAGRYAVDEHLPEWTGGLPSHKRGAHA